MTETVPRLTEGNTGLTALQSTIPINLLRTSRMEGCGLS